MKKLILSLMAAVAFAFGSYAQNAKPAAKKETVKETTTKKTESEKKVVTDKNGTVLKKDGTADKRYKKKVHIKKDGTPDRRYKENK